MINTRNIISYNINKDKDTDKYYREYKRRYNIASSIDQKRLDKIDDLINEIVFLIRIKSFWTYTPPATFTYLSDFKYNGNEISFITNKIEDGLLGDNKTPIEESFYNEYKDLLTKLISLVKEREELLPSYSNKVIDIRESLSKEQTIKDNKKVNSIVGTSSYLANQFIINYHGEGIQLLIKLLNDFSSDIDLNKEYFDKVFKGYQTEFLYSLLELASLYSNKVQIAIEYLVEYRKVISLEFPLEKKKK